MSASATNDRRCHTARNDVKEFEVLENTGDVVRRFFPLDRLRKYFTSKKVLYILGCPCATCVSDRTSFGSSRNPSSYLEAIVGPPSDKPDTSHSAYALLGLLIYIEHPSLIIGFLERSCCDFQLENFPDYFTRNKLEGCCKDYVTIGSPEFKRFASEFIFFMPQFGLPRMDSGKFVQYGPSRVLPFINETKIGVQNEQGEIVSEGSNGNVYAFDIYNEYLGFSHAPDIKKFARKELEKTSDFVAFLEKNNLEIAGEFQDKHIVKLIKAYKHGNTVNLIFPFAKTNLDHLLRDSDQGFGDFTFGPIGPAKAWKQLLGVAKALGKIAGLADPSSVHRGSMLGFHFDLKPANILINSDGTWVISDFGQATFKHTVEGGSRVVNGGGTDAYAPPEIDNINTNFTQRYDIWSLGCIILEVAAFIVLGHDGLQGCSDFPGLDQVRRTTSAWSRLQDDRFFCQETKSGEYKVKPEIVKFMAFLKSSAESRDQKSKTFLDEILALVKRMLEPKVDERVDIEEVIRLLDAAIKQATPSRTSAEPLPMLPAPGERAIGSQDLNHLEFWRIRWEGKNESWERVSLQVFEEKHGLRMQSITDNGTSSEAYLNRMRDKLIPEYAFWDSSTHLVSKRSISFSDMDVKGAKPHAGLIYSADLRSSFLLQSNLTNQKVVVDFPLKSVKLKRYISPKERVEHFGNHLVGLLTHKKILRHSENEDRGPGRVQLWVETGNENPTRSEETEHMHVQGNNSRQVRRHPSFQAATLRRMVIYLRNSRSIITIPMEKNWRVQKAAPEPKTLVFGPTDKTQDAHFRAFWLQPSSISDPGSFAGIPLSCQRLLRTEYNGRFEADRLELTFEADGSDGEFNAKYLGLKEAWSKETKALEKKQGYTSVYRPPPPEPEPESSFNGAVRKGKAPMLPLMDFISRSETQRGQEGLVNSPTLPSSAGPSWSSTPSDSSSQPSQPPVVMFQQSSAKKDKTLLPPAPLRFHHRGGSRA